VDHVDDDNLMKNDRIVDGRGQDQDVKGGNDLEAAADEEPLDVQRSGRVVLVEEKPRDQKSAEDEKEIDPTQPILLRKSKHGPRKLGSALAIFRLCVAMTRKMARQRRQSNQAKRLIVSG